MRRYDLALLTVDDASFFDGVTPIELGALPEMEDSVRVVGYPIGGVAISVSAGVVSRIEVTSYSHGCSELLGLQIDAAINSGRGLHSSTCQLNVSASGGTRGI